MDKYRSSELREQLKEVLEVDLLEGSYYFQNRDVFIKSKIKSFEIIKNYLGEEDYFDIELENGHIGIEKGTTVTKIKRLPNSIIKFDWCFSIMNKDEELIGYIGKLKEVTE